MAKKVIVGGTFDHVHLGHEKLLRTALEKGDTTIGLVSDEMLEEWKPQVSNSYEEREKKLKSFLVNYENWSIEKIDDPHSKAVEGDFDVLVVSYETRERGEEINEMRKKRGKEPLELVEVKPVLAEDLLPLKSTRIRQGEVNEAGERISPVKVHLGSENPVKKKVTKEYLSDLFQFEMVCKGIEGIEEQPFGEDIIRNAKERAKVLEGFDYGIGIESGIIRTEEQAFSLEYVVIKDKMGFTSMGHGPGFPIPEDWVEEIKKGMTLGEKVRVIFGDDDEDLGAVGLLTDAEVKREDCIRSAFSMAMIPRLKAEIYR